MLGGAGRRDPSEVSRRITQGERLTCTNPMLRAWSAALGAIDADRETRAGSEKPAGWKPDGRGACLPNTTHDSGRGRRMRSIPAGEAGNEPSSPSNLTDSPSDDPFRMWKEEACTRSFRWRERRRGCETQAPSTISPAAGRGRRRRLSSGTRCNGEGRYIQALSSHWR